MADNNNNYIDDDDDKNNDNDSKTGFDVAWLESRNNAMKKIEKSSPLDNYAPAWYPLIDDSFRQRCL